MTIGDGITVASVWAFAAVSLLVPGYWCLLAIFAAGTVTGMLLREENRR